MEIEISQLTCAECHIPFWVSAKHFNKLVETHENFTCPNGHSLSFKGETEAEKFKRLYEQSKQDCIRMGLIEQENRSLQRKIKKLEKQEKSDDKTKNK